MYLVALWQRDITALNIDQFVADPAADVLCIGETVTQRKLSGVTANDQIVIACAAGARSLVTCLNNARIQLQGMFVHPTEGRVQNSDIDAALQKLQFSDAERKGLSPLCVAITINGAKRYRLALLDALKDRVKKDELDVGDVTKLMHELKRAHGQLLANYKIGPLELQCMKLQAMCGAGSSAIDNTTREKWLLELKDWFAYDGSTFTHPEGATILGDELLKDEAVNLHGVLTKLGDIANATADMYGGFLNAARRYMSRYGAGAI